MNNKLVDILAHKAQEVETLKAQLMAEPEGELAAIFHGGVHENHQKRFYHALNAEGLSVIAEIKRHSPAKGALSDISDPCLLAQRYVAGGAVAISILTDQYGFSGSLNDLLSVKSSLNKASCAVLRKDFVIEKIQIAESVVAGADAVLLIVAVLQEKTADFVAYAKRLGIDALVEVHSPDELDVAIQSGADIIGVNNRNLKTFKVDTQHAFEVVEQIPNKVIKVAESGIATPELAREYHQAGFDAVLVGEMLVKASEPAHLIQSMRE